MPVSLVDVGHRFHAGPELFSGLNVRLEPGVLYAVTGPSGSGKSTLLGVIAGVIEPSIGRVERDAALRLCWVFQNPFGAPRRTALDHVVLPMLAQGLERSTAEREAQQVFEDFGLADRQSALYSELSGGEAQRLMLARAVVAKPDVMLIDEPTAQLDRSTALQVNAAIKVLAGRGVAVVIATHDPATREACDRDVTIGVRA